MGNGLMDLRPIRPAFHRHRGALLLRHARATDGWRRIIASRRRLGSIRLKVDTGGHGSHAERALSAAKCMLVSSSLTVADQEQKYKEMTSETRYVSTSVVNVQGDSIGILYNSRRRTGTDGMSRCYFSGLFYRPGPEAVIGRGYPPNVFWLGCLAVPPIHNTPRRNFQPLQKVKLCRDFVNCIPSSIENYYHKYAKYTHNGAPKVRHNPTLYGGHARAHNLYFRRVLMLGAGFVTKPTLDILSESGIPVTVGMGFPSAETNAFLPVASPLTLPQLAGLLNPPNLSRPASRIPPPSRSMLTTTRPWTPSSRSTIWSSA